MMRRRLPESSSEYQHLASKFLTTASVPSRERFGSSSKISKKFDVVGIEKVVLPTLEGRFRRHCLELAAARGKTRSGDFALNLNDCRAGTSDDVLGGQYLLYHGCQYEVVPSILSEGFNPSRAGERNGHMFGRGTYFADVSAKADTYVDTIDARKCMIVAEVCLGRFIVSKSPMSGLKTSTEDNNHHHQNAAFDSVVAATSEEGGLLDHREYVVFDGAQAIPRYLIWYRHEASCGCSRCQLAQSCCLSPTLDRLSSPPTDGKEDGRLRANIWKASDSTPSAQSSASSASPPSTAASTPTTSGTFSKRTISPSSENPHALQCRQHQHHHHHQHQQQQQQQHHCEEQGTQPFRQPQAALKQQQQQQQQQQQAEWHQQQHQQSLRGSKRAAYSSRNTTIQRMGVQAISKQVSARPTSNQKCVSPSSTSLVLPLPSPSSSSVSPRLPFAASPAAAGPVSPAAATAFAPPRYPSSAPPFSSSNCCSSCSPRFAPAAAEVLRGSARVVGGAAPDL